jgi:type II secretory pathway pseudopilin PulG
MSELQNDDVDLEVIESADVENLEIDSELAPDSEAEHEEQPQVDNEAVNQEAINKAINKKHFEMKQAERERDQYAAQVAEFQKQQREAQAAKVGNIPPKPDAFDDDYDEKMEARDEAIRQQSEYNAHQSYYNNQQQYQQQQANEAKQAELQKQVLTYTNRATELGIKPDELQAAANTIVNYGINDDLQMHILADKDGPLITKYLAANPQDGFELASMSPYGVGRFLDGIKAKAQTLKPKTTNAPKPATNLQGNGADPELGKYPLTAGAKFE